MKKKKDAKKVIAGMIGGAVVSKKKTKAARANGAKGGRPRTRPPFIGV